ncbi:MAG: GGDEF domain-containing phosphodiesterase [Burkholderiaceae bacterium]
MHADDQTDVRRQLHAARNGDTEWRFTHRMRCKDHTEKWLSWTLRSLPNEQYIFALVRDITKQQRRERRLTLDRGRLERAIRGTQEGLWEWNVVTDAVYLSPRFKKLLGFADHELPNHRESFFTRVHPGNLHSVRRIIERHLRRRIPYKIELRLLTKAGEFRWYCIRGMGEWGEAGQAICQTGCMGDITERKLAEQRQRENEQRLNFALEATEFGDWSMDIAANLVIRSRQHDRCFGYEDPPAIWNYKSFMHHIHPDDRGMVHMEYVDAMNGKGDFDVEMRVVWPDQTVHWLWSKGRFYFRQSGELERVAGFVVEITRKKLEEAALKETEGRYTLLFNNNLDAITQTTVKGVILAANPAACAILGASEETIMRYNNRDFTDEQDGRHAIFAESLYRDGYARGDLRLRRIDGSGFDADVSCSVYKDYSQKTILSFTFRDVTAQKKAELAVHQMAFYDPLTGLANRRLLLDRMKQLLASTKRTEQCSSVFFIDLDFFKNVNDARGHAVGDILLKKVAERLTDFLREGDTLARIGGDEFIVLATNLSDDLDQCVERASLIAEKIRASLCEPFVIDDLPYNLGCSIGITFLSKHNDSAEDLLREADTAMYHAKEAGRNRVSLFQPGMHRNAIEHLSLKNDLLNAMSRNEMSMHIQSQVDHCGTTVGAELLMRWTHPVRGDISPVIFIPLAEKSGAILSLGDWALEQGCQLIRRLTETGTLIPISVNISPRQFRRDDFADQVLQILQKTGASPSSLVLEVTEGLLIDNVDTTVRMMKKLAASGIRFSIDDFGTGYSSLAYIRRLPLHEIKIDRSFVKSVPDDADDTAIVQTITAMAKNLGLKVVAEGVETVQQAEFLVAAGCDAMQGYLYSCPMAIDKWMATHVAKDCRQLEP